LNTDFPHIPVEQTFNELVREHGGAIILDEYYKEKTGKPPEFPNADYIFHSEKVVAELKCLMDDNSDSPNNQDKINAALDRFYSAGKIKSKVIDEAAWPNLPKELQNEIYSITTRSIRARVKKANRQIRETKAKLGLDSYSGVLFIANDGLISMPPAAFIHATINCIKSDGENISCFVFFTVNVFAVVKGNSVPAVFWMPMQMEKPEKVDNKFTRRIGKAWQIMIKKKLGIEFADHEIMDEDMEAFWKARNLPNE
jgi:hypothetical protein